MDYFNYQINYSRLFSKSLYLERQILKTFQASATIKPVSAGPAKLQLNPSFPVLSKIGSSQGNPGQKNGATKGSRAPKYA
jgi:hypothetical protein